MASLAQQESESLLRNVTMGLRYRYQQGKVIVNTNHFLGYNKDDDGNLIIDPEQAKTVKRIFYSYLKGMTPLEIKRDLEKADLKSGANKTRWHTNTIMDILHNEKYIGDALLQKTYTVDFLTKKRTNNTGAIPQYYIENDHPATISKPVFYQVQQILQKKHTGITTRNGRHHKYSTKYCFSSKVFCSRCGDVYKRCIWYKPERVHVWRCSTRVTNKQNKTHCFGRDIKEPYLKEATIKAFNQLISEHDLADKQIEANILRATANTAGATLEEINDQLERQQQQMVIQANHGQDISQIANQVKILRQQHDLLTEKNVNQSICTDNLKRIKSFIQAHPIGLTEFDQELVRLLIEKIIIHSNFIEFVFKDSEIIKVKA